MEISVLLRMTKKARTKLKVSDNELVECDEPPVFLSEWYLNLCRLERKTYFVLTESTSLFTIFLDGKGVNSLGAFGRILPGAIANGIRDTTGEINARPIQVAALACAKTSNRRILGSQNDLIWMAEIRKSTAENVDQVYTASVNDTPMTFLGTKSPLFTFLKSWNQLESRTGSRR